MGTEVVGVYTSFENARLAADNYVVDSNIYELEDEENDMWRDELLEIDWYNEGCYRQEYDDVNTPDDRVRIQKQKLDQ